MPYDSLSEDLVWKTSLEKVSRPAQRRLVVLVD